MLLSPPLSWKLEGPPLFSTWLTPDLISEELLHRSEQKSGLLCVLLPRAMICNSNYSRYTSVLCPTLRQVLCLGLDTCPLWALLSRCSYRRLDSVLAWKLHEGRDLVQLVRSCVPSQPAGASGSRSSITIYPIGECFLEDPKLWPVIVYVCVLPWGLGAP